MAEGYLFRVYPTGSSNRSPQYWYANIADQQDAVAAVMLAANVIFAASVQMASHIGQEMLSYLKIPIGEVRRD